MEPTDSEKHVEVTEHKQPEEKDTQATKTGGQEGVTVNVEEFINETGKEIDYDKLINDFGCHKIDEELLLKFEKVTGHKPHIFLRRGIFFSHRDLHAFLKHYEEGKPVFLYTGRGPSGGMHLGHCLPFFFTKYLQDVFKCPVVIQLTDDEKYFMKGEKDKQDITHYRDIGNDNAKDIIACGFDKERTFIFRNTDYIGTMYENVCRFQRCLTYSQCKNIFGLTPSHNVGRVAFPAIQAVPAFSNTFPHIFGKNTKVLCLIPQGIDQDPYFRMTRDIAARLKYQKPCCIHSKFFPGLHGFGTKMSSSDPNSCILLTDTKNQIKNKINKYAFSGGQATAEEQREKGANLQVDIPYNYLSFFLEDDEKLKEIGEQYAAGKLMTGEVKKLLIEILQDIITKHQDIRSKISDEELKDWFAIRPLKLHKDQPETPTLEQTQAEPKEEIKAD